MEQAIDHEAIIAALKASDVRIPKYKDKDLYEKIEYEGFNKTVIEAKLAEYGAVAYPGKSPQEVGDLTAKDIDVLITVYLVRGTNTNKILETIDPEVANDVRKVFTIYHVLPNLKDLGFGQRKEGITLARIVTVYPERAVKLLNKYPNMKVNYICPKPAEVPREVCFLGADEIILKSINDDNTGLKYKEAVNPYFIWKLKCLLTIKVDTEKAINSIRASIERHTTAQNAQIVSDLQQNIQNNVPANNGLLGRFLSNLGLR